MPATARSVLILDDFADEAKAMRRAFDERQGEPGPLRPERCVWDYWHVPERYTLLRTPAWLYFPPRLYDAFHQRLVAFGRRVLGCHDVSPPWLSCYIDGCSQSLHGDLPHGPWAFVFSLTRWQGRRFSGGETLILDDAVLDYWSEFESRRGLEHDDLLKRIPPRFNRLTLFDPRLPHAVRQVEGTRELRDGRLVIHGWFVEPRPFIEGPLPRRALAQHVADLPGVLGPWLGDLPLAGAVSFALDTTAAGTVRKVALLSDNTRVAAPYETARKELVGRLGRHLRTWRFPKAKAASRLTLPIVFER